MPVPMRELLNAPHAEAAGDMLEGRWLEARYLVITPSTRRPARVALAAGARTCHAHAMHLGMHMSHARWLPPLQAAGWRDRSELVELAGNSLTTRARGTGAGGGDGDGADDVSQHARLLEGLLPPYAPIERGAVKVRARVRDRVRLSREGRSR
eukprot:scaffold19369_cov38-Phaeocystis_antarctica.AAC.2